MRQPFIPDGTPQIFDLAASGAVRLYDASTKTWTPVTGPGTVASALVETSYLQQTGTKYTRLDRISRTWATPATVYCAFVQ